MGLVKRPPMAHHQLFSCPSPGSRGEDQLVALPLDKLGHHNKRIERNIHWIIIKKGKNEYKEGPKPPVLALAERRQLAIEIPTFLDKPYKAAAPVDLWQDIYGLLGIKDGQMDKSDGIDDSREDDFVIV
jgi:hypothetical protein